MFWQKLNPWNNLISQDGGADCECGKVKDVVCGSDNVTYMNECVLEDCEAKHKPGKNINNY